jgi:tetratricopeptide (TPR) repeat protein
MIITKPTNKPCSKFLHHCVICLLFLLFTTVSTAQFNIAGMKNNGQVVYTAKLTIHEPGQAPYTESVQYNPNKYYSFGTTITTFETAVSTMYKGQRQIIHPNSALKLIKEKYGIKAQTVKGTVDHILKDVKQNVGFYKAGNGYTWAHAEGTQLRVQAAGHSKKVNIETYEGQINIIDQVPVKINQTKTTNIGGKKVGSELTTTIRTLKRAGEAYSSGQNSRAIVYQTYEQAIDAFVRDTYNKEQSGTAYIEELAENYSLIGELYMEIGQFEKAIEPLGKAVEFMAMSDPEDIYIIDTSLYLSEAMIGTNVAEYKNIGNNLAVEIINILIAELNEYETEYKYAVDYQDEDWAWDICYDLVDINEYLGWAYELLNDFDKADEFYAWAYEYESRL